MKHVLIYEDENGYCRIVVPDHRFRQDWETEQNAIARLHEVAIPRVVEFLACSSDDVPKDQTFRDAWKKGTTEEPIKVDFQKALQIHRKRLSKASQSKIEELKHQYDLSIEKDDLPLSVAIRRTIAILRTLHEMNLTHCKTAEDIKYSIPQELHDVWTWYLPKK